VLVRIGVIADVVPGLDGLARVVRVFGQATPSQKNNAGTSWSSRIASFSGRVSVGASSTVRYDVVIALDSLAEWLQAMATSAGDHARSPGEP